MSSDSIQIAKYLLSDILVTSMRVNRHAEIIFLKLLSSKVRIFRNLPIFEGKITKMKMWDRSYDHQICTVDSS